MEVNQYASLGADPLLHDADADFDCWYWFQDCDDDDFDRSPFKPEVLDAKDNDCDDVVDEDFFELDSDGDGLYDYEEYHNVTSDPGLPDSDSDGMSDGHEVKVTGSDPLKFNFDRDEDGFYDFEDCEDLVETLNPNGIEARNGWDDDCNDAVDDALDRRNLVTTEPNFHLVHSWDAVNDTLVLTISAIPPQVEAGISWQFGDFTLTDNVSSDSKTVAILPIDCEARDGTLTIYLCDQGSGPQQVTATIVDSGVTTVSVSYTHLTLPTKA